MVTLIRRTWNSRRSCIRRWRTTLRYPKHEVGEMPRITLRCRRRVSTKQQNRKRATCGYSERGKNRGFSNKLDRGHIAIQ